MRLITVLIIFYCCLLNACSKKVYKGDPAKSAAIRQSVMPADTLTKKQRGGIDLYADGNNPVAWTLELDLEKGFTFKATGNIPLIAGAVPPANSTNPDAETYLTKTDSGLMKIVVYTEPCVVSAKGKTSRKVEVTVNDRRYSGCGSYLYDYLVNDVWELQYIDNRDPAPSKKQLPRMEFNLEQNKMNGYDGCNNISSDIEIKGNHIKFSAFAGTKLSCPGNETEKIFSTMLSGHTVDYTIENRRLTIYLINDSRLTFTKVE